jgi:hypothetical protein
MSRDPQGDRALALAERSPVLPVWTPDLRTGRCDCGNVFCQSPGKHPVGHLVPNGKSEATQDPDRIRSWWREGAWNIGRRLDGLVVLDGDAKTPGYRETLRRWAAEGKPLPPTPTQLTGRVNGTRGMHLIYKAPEGVTFHQHPPDWDGWEILVAPAYILHAGSLHPSGEVYEMVWNPPVAELPEWVITEAAKRPDRSGQDNGDRLDLAAMFEGVPEGERDGRFWRYASSLRGRNVRIEEAKALVEAAWQRADSGHHPFPLGTALEKVDRAYAQYEPNEPDEPKAKVLNLRLGKKKLAKLERQVQAGGDLVQLLSDLAEPSQAVQLVQMAEELYEFHQSLEGKPFVVPKDGPNIARMLRGSRSSLRAELAAVYNERSDGAGVPNSEAMSAAMRVIEGKCLKTEPVELHLRLARVDDGIVIDLGDEQGRAVVVKPGEWRHLTKPPVIFKRTRLTAPLPLPVPGGDLEELRGLLNVSDRAWPLLVAYLVAALVPDLPHPVLLLRGEQGTGKTTAARLLSRTVDPATAQTRTAPRDTRSWVISVAGAWMVVLDNLSGIQDWLSDAICRSVTGDGWVDRELYTDEELTVISNRRVVVLNSIDPGALRGDLGDRLVPIELERIEEDERRLDSEIEAEFRRVHPVVFGALLDLLAQVLEELPEVELEGLPRMADFAKVVAAVDKVQGTEALDGYLAIRSDIAQEVVAGDPVAVAVQKFMVDKGEWTGTATELLGELDPWPKPEGWPKGPQPLSAALKRAAPSLRQADEDLRVDVSFGKSDRSTRRIRLRNPNRAPQVPGADQ